MKKQSRNLWVFFGNVVGLLYNFFALLVAHSLAAPQQRTILEALMVSLAALLAFTGIGISGAPTLALKLSIWGIMSNVRDIQNWKEKEPLLFLWSCERYM
jgi:bacteriorhodopsin